MHFRFIAVGMLAACMVSAADAATLVLYGFEDVAPNNNADGSLSSLDFNTQGLRGEISRPGNRFDVVERGSQPVPLSFGDRALSPFNDTDGDPFIINFDTPILSFNIRGGDFGADSPDRLEVSAYAGENLTGRRLDIDRELLRSSSGSTDFGFEELSVNSERLIRSVELSGGTGEFPQSIFWSEFSVNLPTERETTVVGSYTAAIDRARFGPTREQSISEFIACTEDPNCDLDEAYARTQEDVRTITEPLADAAFASRELVTRTSILPDNLVETILDVPFFFENALDGLQRLGPLDLLFDGNVENVEASGDGGSFEVNPEFDFLELEILFDLPESALNWDGSPVTYFSDVSLLGNSSAAGTMLFSETIGAAAGNRRIKLQLTQIESSDYSPLAPVPLPASFWLLGLSFAFVGGLRSLASRRS